jgi:uncharacterized membrane protein
MRIKSNVDLVLINGATIVLALVILIHPDGPERVLLGIPFILLFPGYSFIAFIAPRKTNLEPLVRAVLSVALSMISFPLIGLLLNYTPWGITMNSSLIYLGLTVLIFSAGAWWRRLRAPLDERFVLEIKIPRPALRGEGKADLALNMFLGMALILALLSMGYAYLSPKDGERFTEFYILGQNGKITYTQSVRAGEPFPVVLGVRNKEGQPTAYTVKVQTGKDEPLEQWQLVLMNEQVEEKEIELTLHGESIQDIEFNLYREGSDDPYRELNLWLNVVGNGDGYSEFQAFIQPPALNRKSIIVNVIITNHMGKDMYYTVLSGDNPREGPVIPGNYPETSPMFALEDGESRLAEVYVDLPIHPGSATDERVYLYLFEIPKRRIDRKFTEGASADQVFQTILQSSDEEPSQVVSIPIRSFSSR